MDYAVGSCLAVDNDSLREVFDTYIKPWGTIKRGDDLLVSLAFSHYFKSKHRTIATEVTLLDEKNVGLNKHPDHCKMRWEVIQEFKKIHYEKSK